MATASPALELVVRAALEDEVRRLVDQLAPEVAAAVVAERLNGAGGQHSLAAIPEASAVRTATKVCRSCNQEKPATAFEKGRLQCKDCRRDAARHRANGNAAEVAAIPLEQP